jgi:hypothetical protein
MENQNEKEDNNKNIENNDNQKENENNDKNDKNDNNTDNEINKNNDNNTKSKEEIESNNNNNKIAKEVSEKKEESEKEENESESEELFSEIVCKEILEETKKEENSKCFDCNNTPANWICVNNGIYLCASCAGEHRSYGNIISNIKFLLLDELNEFQISLMKISGNLRLKNLLINYNVDYQNYDKLYLFSSKLLEWYRTVLYNTLIAQPLPKPPGQTLALQIMDNFKENKRPPIDYVVVEESDVKYADGNDNEKNKNSGDLSSIKQDNKNNNNINVHINKIKNTLGNMSNCKNQ